jgi:hypothetical protein
MSVQSLAPRLPTVLATALAAALLALLGTGIACIRADRAERSGRTASASSSSSASPSASPSSSPAPGPTVAPEGSTVADDLGADSHPEGGVEGGALPLDEGGTAHAAHRFDDPEEWAKRFETPEREAWQKPDSVVEMMSVLPGMVVADLGAGTGYFLPHLSRAVGETGRVLALDVEREELFNVKPRAVPPDDPALPPAGVDRVLIVNTWHHIADRVKYTERLAKGLAPTGSVWIVDTTQESPMGPPAAERLSPATVVAELTAGGLEAEVVPANLPYQYVVVGRRP